MKNKQILLRLPVLLAILVIFSFISCDNNNNVQNNSKAPIVSSVKAVKVGEEVRYSFTAVTGAQSYLILVQQENKETVQIIATATAANNANKTLDGENNVVTPSPSNIDSWAGMFNTSLIIGIVANMNYRVGVVTVDFYNNYSDPRWATPLIKY